LFYDARAGRHKKDENRRPCKPLYFQGKLVTISTPQNIEAIAQSLVDDAPSYLTAVSALSGSHELHAVDDIVSASGIKLVARGTKIDPRLREKLSGHRISGVMLEKSVSIAGGVTPASLARDAARLIDKDHWLAVLAAKSGDPAALRHGLSRVALADALRFRLTVAREERAELYRHSFSVAIICHYLALRLNLAQAATDNVLIAALCHDLGELYTDPAILKPGHRVSDEERRFIYVHPITGWLVARDVPGINPEILKAIIQHQERLDGSGYPFGIRGEAIGLTARILSVADVCAAIMARFEDHRRLSTLLRLNRSRYEKTLVDLIHETIARDEPARATVETEAWKARLLAFMQLHELWSGLRANPATAQSAPVVFLTDRMYALRTAVLSCGFDPDSLDMLLELAATDAVVANELAAVVDELGFLLSDLERETDRRMPEWRAGLDPAVDAALKDFQERLRACNQA
jgi:HD-GYP domain-containing protein (c-di-GMP phosphodiesterase class II)